MVEGNKKWVKLETVLERLEFRCHTHNKSINEEDTFTTHAHVRDISQEKISIKYVTAIKIESFFATHKHSRKFE